MLPSASFLYRWWLGPGRDALAELVDPDSLGSYPGDVGFAQQLWLKLEAFDDDCSFRDCLRSQWTRESGSCSAPRGSNPRKLLNEAAVGIFRASNDGGINRSRVLEGLGYLDMAEVQRLELMSAIQLALDRPCPNFKQAQVIEELHRAASKRYEQFHMSLRSYVSNLSCRVTCYGGLTRCLDTR